MKPKQSILVFQALWLCKCTSENLSKQDNNSGEETKVPTNDAAADAAILKYTEDESQDECQEFWVKAENLQL